MFDADGHIASLGSAPAAGGVGDGESADTQVHLVGLQDEA